MPHQPRTGAALFPSVQLHVSEMARLHDALRRMQRHVGSAVIVRVIQPAQAFRLYEAAGDGDQEAEAVLLHTMGVVDRLAHQLGRAPASCAVCGKPIFRMRFSAVAVAPFLTWPNNGVSIAVCKGCGVEPARITAAVVRACRVVWPEMQTVEQTHSSGGRA